MPEYRVGKIYHPGKTRWQEGTDFNYRANSLELRMFFSNLTHSDIRAMRGGRCTFAFAVIEGIIFFLFEFGRACPLSDNSYSIHLVPETERTLPPVLAAGEMPLLYIVLVRAETGIIEALRVISLGHNFSKALFDAIREQAARPFNHAEHDRKLAAVYARYPTAESLLRLAEATCTIEVDNVN